MHKLHTRLICASAKHPISGRSPNICAHWDHNQILHNILMQCVAGGTLQLTNSTSLHTDRKFLPTAYRNGKSSSR